MSDQLPKYGSGSDYFVPIDWVSITPGAGLLANPLRAIRANEAGTITVTMKWNGQSRVLNFLAGETRLGWFSHVTAASGITTIEGAV